MAEPTAFMDSYFFASRLEISPSPTHAMARSILLALLVRSCNFDSAGVCGS
jgi:hypothetical protein